MAGLVFHRTVAVIRLEDESVRQHAADAEIRRSQGCCQLEQYVRPAVQAQVEFCAFATCTSQEAQSCPCQFSSQRQLRCTFSEYTIHV